MKQTFKRLTAIFAAAALAVTCLPLTAIAETLPQEEILAAGDTGTYQGFNYKELEDGTLAITGYVGSDTEIVIPAEIEGKKVTVIGDGAFTWISITKITIPDGVTTIGESAFNKCTLLTEINVDKNNKNFCSIDGVLFNKDVTTLIRFPIDKNVTSYAIPDGVITIGYCAFAYCKSPTEITVPNGVTSIVESAFCWCESLTKIHLPDSLTTIGGWAFAGCSSLTEITFPDSLTEIGNRAFPYCNSLKKITIPKSVTTIGIAPFDSCSSLTEINVDENNKNYCSIDGVLFNKDVTTLIQFPKGKNVTSYVVPDGVTTIGIQAFDACLLLTEITLPDSLTTIEEDVFEFCSSLTKVTIPASVTEIGYNVFYGCPDDLTIYGYTGSYAETYAYDNGIKFVAISDLIPGDVNGDGEVGELDSVELARYLANWNVTIDKDAADLDGDGEVGETDSVILARRLAGWNV